MRGLPALALLVATAAAVAPSEDYVNEQEFNLAAAVPAQNAGGMLNQAISGVVSQFPTLAAKLNQPVSSVEVKQIVGRGFTHFSQTVDVQHLTGVHHDNLPRLFAMLRQQLKLSPAQTAQLEPQLSSIMFQDSTDWVLFKLIYNSGSGGQCKQTTIMANNNPNTRLTNWVIGVVGATFKLAPDIVVLVSSRSYLGGLFSSTRVRIQEIPRGLTQQDMETLFTFFDLVAFRRFAEVMGISAGRQALVAAPLELATAEEETAAVAPSEDDLWYESMEVFPADTQDAPVSELSASEEVSESEDLPYDSMEVFPADVEASAPQAAALSASEESSESEDLPYDSMEVFPADVEATQTTELVAQQAAPGQPSPNALQSITGAINSISSTWQGLVGAFKTTTSKTVQQTIKETGWSKLRQSVSVYKGWDVEPNYLNQYIRGLLNVARLPKKYQADAEFAITSVRFSSGQQVVKWDLVFSTGQKGQARYVCVTGTRDPATQKTSWLVANMGMSFKLADDVWVIRKSSSIAGGIFSKEGDSVKRIPRAITQADVEGLMSIMTVAVLKNMGDAIGVSTPNIQLPAGFSMLRAEASATELAVASEESTDTMTVLGMPPVAGALVLALAVSLALVGGAMVVVRIARSKRSKAAAEGALLQDE